VNEYEYDLAPPTHAQRWRGYNPTKEDDIEALEQCKVLATAAKVEHEAGRYEAVCVMGEPVFYFDWPHALMPGHIYSEAGMDEFTISRSCEYHFDEWTKEPEDG